MRRFVPILISAMLTLLPITGLCGCDKDGTEPELPGGIIGPDDPNPENPTPENPKPTDTTPSDPTTGREVYFKVSSNGDTTYEMPETASGSGTYLIKLNLAVGARVTIYDNSGKTYSSYSGDFDGAATIAGEYTFELRISGASGTVYVTVPQQTTPVDPEPPITTPETPKNTKVTVTYTNSNYWDNVYAYMWNYSTGVVKAAWPGEKLTGGRPSGIGDEVQYSLEIDYSVYDRIIFNNGQNGVAGQKTKDLVVGAATSGYYGEDGVFTVMSSEDYGSVKYVTLTDNKNLNYAPNQSKKISIYTPRGYNQSDKTKKYGLLYIFDGQNIYTAANGASVGANGGWSVDVAVSNLMANGGDGIIIVGIDNANSQRDQELTMSPSFGTVTDLAYNDLFRNGKLEQLGDFIKETVMPYISRNYNVDASREKTGIAGASSGGLAAYYLGLRDNDLYGYIGALSPANGLFNQSDWTRFYAGKNFGAGRPKIYAYCGYGTKDEDELIPATREIKKKLPSYGFAADSIIENYVENGVHSESYWRIAFMDFLSKML